MSRLSIFMMAIIILTGVMVLISQAQRESMAQEEITPIDYTKVGATVLEGTPLVDGYAMPAEWAKHERTIMVFPNRDQWTRRQLPQAQKQWAAVAKAIANFEPITMVVNKEDERVARKLCGEKVELIVRKAESGWARDTGPIVLMNDKGDRRISGFVFNAWGEKSDEYKNDQLIAGHIAKLLNLKMYAAPMVLEGGSITVDGEGTLLAVETSILNKNRNPGMTKAKAEQIMKAYLGVKKIIWLPRGLVPDPITDGHVDGLCVFIGPGRVMLQTTDDKQDENYGVYKAALEILENTTDAKGRKLEIVSMPMSLGSVNFYICNGAVITPVFGYKADDKKIIAIMEKAFPDRKIVPVLATMIEEGGGGIHCITQQIPAGHTKE